MPLNKLLHLLPQFKDTMVSLTTEKDQMTVPMNLAEPNAGPPLMDSQNPFVKIIMKGRYVHGCIVDGGLGVNAFNKATCRVLGITQWKACPFWLYMLDTQSIRAIYLI